jgi:hypothetical protein
MCGGEGSGKEGSAFNVASVVSKRFVFSCTEIAVFVVIRSRSHGSALCIFLALLASPSPRPRQPEV